MTQWVRIAVWCAVVAAVGHGVSAAGQPANPAQAGPAGGFGRILGIVTDAAGTPIEGALISASGPSGTKLAVGDPQGRFDFRQLAPGPYLLRAHLPGFTAVRRVSVEVGADETALQVVTLHPQAAPAVPPLLAGFGLTGDAQPPADASADTAADVDSDSASDADEAGTPHDHSEKAWRLRHVRRSILKDTQAPVWTAPPAATLPAEMLAVFSRPGTASASLASPLSGSLLGDVPLSGQVQLLTRTTGHSPADLLTSIARPGQTAYVTLQAPAGNHGTWSVLGATTTGDISSWVVAGSYTADPAATRHTYELGLSYSTQRYAGGHPTARTAATAESRNIGRIRAVDRWRVAPRVTIGYGATFAHYDYLDSGVLVSPSASVTITPASGTELRVAVSDGTVAPGEEEFLPRSATGMWLPPERTFAPLLSNEALQVQHTRHVEIGLERELGERLRIGMRRFYQDVDDQLVTLFGRDGPGSTGHYYLASAGMVDSSGWSVRVSQSLTDRVRSAVDYSLIRAQWQPTSRQVLAERWPAMLRVGAERLHDVTTSVETEFPETATRVFVVCRVNTGFAPADLRDPGAGLDARFDVRVKQALPFTPLFEGSDWALLVAVRSLFRDPQDGASLYDELLVVGPPKQVVGGLVVHF